MKFLVLAILFALQTGCTLYNVGQGKDRAAARRVEQRGNEQQKLLVENGANPRKVLHGMAYAEDGSFMVGVGIDFFSVSWKDGWNELTSFEAWGGVITDVALIGGAYYIAKDQDWLGLGGSDGGGGGTAKKSSSSVDARTEGENSPINITIVGGDGSSGSSSSTKNDNTAPPAFPPTP